MPYINIHDGAIHTLNPLSLLALSQTFEMVFTQYDHHPEYKSLGPDGGVCNADTRGLLGRYPITASEFRLIGKETERGWENSEDVSTLLPSLLQYQQNDGVLAERIRERLQRIPLSVLESETGLSRHTLVRIRKGLRVQARSKGQLKADTLVIRTSEQGCTIELTHLP